MIARALAADPALTAEMLPEMARRAPQTVEVRRCACGSCTRRRRGCRALTQHALDARTHPAWTRLKFDELLAQQLSLKAHRQARAAAPRAGADRHWRADRTRCCARVPFKLTRAQERVWREIAHDLKRATPMQRLLQGDVGSGKTIVAALAALQAIESGRAGRVHGADGNPRRAALSQARCMARRPAGARSRGCPVGCRRRSAGRRSRRSRAARRSSRSARTRCSRRAWSCRELGLAIIDEQHRFGVAQRLALRGKGAGAKRTS